MWHLLNKKCVSFSVFPIAALKPIQELFFHDSICEIKIHTGGELIWNADCQMPITGSVGSGKVGPGIGFTVNIFNVLSCVVMGQQSH